MTKFEIIRNTVEISYKNRSEIKEGCTINQDNQEPELIKSFDVKEEALEALKDYKSEVIDLSGGAGTYYSVIEYYVEEHVYDEEGDLIDFGDIWEFSELKVDFE